MNPPVGVGIEVDVEEIGFYFTIGLLRAIPEAVATDDHTSHPWRLEEVLNGVRVKGRPFFDYGSRISCFLRILSN